MATTSWGVGLASRSLPSHVVSVAHPTAPSRILVAVLRAQVPETTALGVALGDVRCLVLEPQFEHSASGSSDALAEKRARQPQRLGRKGALAVDREGGQGFVLDVAELTEDLRESESFNEPIGEVIRWV